MNEQIKDMAKLMCEDCATSGTYCPTDLCDDVVRQAQVLYNAGYRKQSEWISVEDRLPTTYQDVLCYDGHNYCVDFIRLDGTWCDAELHHFEITHWMPLPEAPKGGAK